MEARAMLLPIDRSISPTNITMVMPMLMHKNGNNKFKNPSRLYFDQKNGVVMLTKIRRITKNAMIQ
jgi:hypothetical protein